MRVPVATLLQVQQDNLDRLIAQHETGPRNQAHVDQLDEDLVIIIRGLEAVRRGRQ